MTQASSIAARLDWGALAPLRLRVAQLASGLYLGNHKSSRRGSGIEFDSHRDYMPGDDLRRLDRRALMRHGKLLVRQFQTETDRCLCLLIDATASMGYRSPKAQGAKLAYAALLSAALAKVALATGDTVSLDWISGSGVMPLKRTGGPSSFDRLLDILEHAQSGGVEPDSESSLAFQLHSIARRAQRGSLVVLFSDLLDLPEGAETTFSALAQARRSVVVVQVLDPYEAEFPFQGAYRFRSSSGDTVVETDAEPARAGYLEALSAQRERWRLALMQFGGTLVNCTSADPAINVVREVLRVAGRTP